MTDEHSPTAATETAEVASAPQWPQLRHVDPCELVTDWNVRLDATASRDLVASVRALGVLEPIVAVELPDGRLRVRMGHQHTIAAIAADRRRSPSWSPGPRRTSIPPSGSSSSGPTTNTAPD